MLEEALKGHKSTNSRDFPPPSKQATNKKATLLGPKVKMSGLKEEEESSQSIVDVLFKDFISQKFSGALKEGTESKRAVSAHITNSVDDELSRLLDMEINSIKSKTLHHEEIISTEKLTKRPKSYQHNVSHKKQHFESEREKDDNEKCESNLSPLRNSEKNMTNASNDLLEMSSTFKTNLNEICHTNSSFSTNTISGVTDTLPSSLPITINNLQLCSQALSIDAGPQIAVHELDGTAGKSFFQSMMQVSVAKKLAAPKQLKMKLSTESLSLIKSTDRIDRDGRVWEEGEVYSSHSEKSGKINGESDSEHDGYPSDTGSINSGCGGWPALDPKHKKKHKHRHKRKKKKHSKDKERKTKDKHKKFKDGESIRENELHEEIDDKYSSQQKLNKERTREKERHDSLDKSPDRECSLRKDEDSNKKRKRSHSGSRSRKHLKKSKSDSRSRSPQKHRRSMESDRTCYNEWDARSYSGDIDKRSSRDRSRSKEHPTNGYRLHSRDKSKSKDHNREHSRERPDRHRESSREKSERDLRLQIDKAKLRKIAIANALQNMKAGQGPRVDLTTFKSGGKSVEELTEFCKKISAKSDLSDSNDEMPKISDDEDKLIHHPFKVRDPSTSNIIMNIRNAKQLPVLTPSEKQAQQASLRLTFPVSSGSHHRASESEWVPVEKTSTPPTPSSSTQVKKIFKAKIHCNKEPKNVDSIFPDLAEGQKIDIGSIISERLQAVRKLQENPYDVQALTKMHKVQEQASRWATSKHLPGQFLGTTGAHVLSQEELIGDKKHQAWARKTQLTQAAPVNGGIGMFLLQKMGWKQGEGLGKNNEGNKEPLMLDIKIDRKGLTTATENSKHKTQIINVPRAKDLSNKHPVSALMELCNRRRWGPPIFTVVDESGPDHKKNFLFKVKVNNIEYQPSVPGSNKKTAKAQCAAVCLQEMGLLPRDAPLNI
ncbi:unnamed protein product [Lymnaea stagnalis]|uniref:Protein SON n=1 Tax=Lymnaea stagnalis TaxID=6523 RepID=A0AAV2HTF5_LYMST